VTEVPVVAPVIVEKPINKETAIKAEKDKESEDEEDADDYLDRLEDDS
jgi:hypothetical protein